MRNYKIEVVYLFVSFLFSLRDTLVILEVCNKLIMLEYKLIIYDVRCV